MSPEVQNTELSLGNPEKWPPEHPFLLPPPPPATQSNRETGKVELLVHLSPSTCVPFTCTNRPFTAVTSVKPAQTVGVGLRSPLSQEWGAGKSLVWHKLSSMSIPCLFEPAGLQQCTDKQCQDYQILSELLGVDHRNFASQALTHRWPHIFARL